MLERVDKRFLILVVVFLAFALRLATYFIANNSFGFVPFYDQAVYYSLANSVLHGQKLYIDQIFLHPPSIISLTMPFAALGSIISDVNAAVIQSIFMCLVGAANTYLIYFLAKKFSSRNCALFVSLIYAVFPTSVFADQKGIIEPILNCFILLGLMFLLKLEFANKLDYKQKNKYQIILAGFCFGAASSFKIWGGVFTASIFILFIIYKQYQKSLIFIISALFSFVVLLAPYFVNNFLSITNFLQYTLLDQAAVTISGVAIWKKVLGFSILILWLIIVPNLARKHIIYSDFVKNFGFCCVSVFAGLSLGLILVSRQYWHYWDWFIPYALLFLGGVIYYKLKNSVNSKKFLKGFSNSIFFGCLMILSLSLIIINFYYSFYPPEASNVSQPFKVSYIKSPDGPSALNKYISQKMNVASDKTNKCIYSYADVLLIGNFVTENYQNNCLIQADVYGEFIKDNPTKLSDDMYIELPKYAFESKASFVLVPANLSLYFMKDAVFLSSYTRNTVINNIDIWQKSNISL
ncbi:MAG: glycosyltransferase family 39 protein [Bifidobacteriaceae bacterium]|jgi:4-amino-4-deoxy-L-arabinose transferase-like glycosyltransferase|nr:glycosyltransferase family 39 protein [Bifidobacteriaceae bacterium]